MKNSRLTVLAIVMALALPLTACGTSTPAASSAPAAGAASSTGSSAAAAEKTYVIRLGHSDAPSDESITHYTALVFAEKVKELSNGVINVQIYPSNQLGDQRDQMRALQNGTQEMTQGSVQNFATFAAPLNYFSLPYLFTSDAEVEKAIYALWDQNSDWLVKKGGMRPVVYTLAGFRNLTTDAKHPIRNLNDAKGVKVRIPPNPTSETAFRALGLEPVSLAFSEVFTALQQGVVDGQENAYTTFRTEHYDEVQKYVTDIQWQYTTSMFAMSEVFYQSLPQELQKAVVEAGKLATAAEIEKNNAMKQEDINYLTGKGMEFLGVPSDYDEWVSKGRGIWESQYELIGEGDAAAGKTIVDQVLGIIAK